MAGLPDIGDSGLAESVTNAFAQRRQNALLSRQIQAQNSFRDAVSRFQSAPPEQQQAIGSQMFAADPQGAEQFLRFVQTQNDAKVAADQRQAKITANKLYAVANAPDGQAEATYQAIAPDHYQQMVQAGQLSQDMPQQQREQIIRQTALQHLPEYMARAGMSTAPELKAVSKDQQLVSISPMGGSPTGVYGNPAEETFKDQAQPMVINGKPVMAQIGSKGTVRQVAGASPYKADGGPDKAPNGYRYKGDGTLEFIPGGPADPNSASKGLGGREGVMFQRVVNSANSATEALKNISELPVGASTGVLGVGASPGQSWTQSVKSVLTNKLSSQDVQDYNTMLAGVSRNLSTIESAGLAPNGSLTHSMDSIQIREGDTQITKLRKLAEMRQIIIKGIETNNANPKLPQEQKDLVTGIINQVKQAIPFTQSDITKLQAKQSSNPRYTFQDLMKEQGLSSPQQSANTPNVNAKGWVLHQDAKGNKAYVSPDGKQFEPVQ